MKYAFVSLTILLIVISGCVSVDVENQVKKITVLSKSTEGSYSIGNQFYIEDTNGTMYQVTESVYRFVEPGKTYYFQYGSVVNQNFTDEPAKAFTGVYYVKS